MLFILDTSVAIHLRDRNDAVSAQVSALAGDRCLSILTRIELEGGVVRHPDLQAIRRQRLVLMLASLPTLAFDDAAADRYRDIMVSVGFSRPRIIDRMIAAQALAHQATVVTMNGRDFADIPDLKLIAW